MHVRNHTAEDTPARKAARSYRAAVAHKEANPRAKRAAFDNGVTTRTERRWRTPTEAQGSPLEVYARYVATSQDPARLEVYGRVTREQERLRKLTNEQLIAEIEALHAEDARGEGEDNAARATRGISLRERAAVCERDATHDVKLAARYIEAASRGIPESMVMGR